MTAINHRCAVLGHPIAHSLSPVLHQAAYEALGLNDWHYDRIDMVESNFPDFLMGLDNSWMGLSLTMPLKRTVMGFGRPCDHWSSELSVANTAIPRFSSTDPFDDAQGLQSAHHNSRFRLFNTDVDGIRLAFAHARMLLGKMPYEGSERAEHLGIVILGNGNTALSALAAASTMAKHIDVTVAARHPAARTTMAQFASRHRHHITITAIPLDTAHNHLADADIIISTLPAHAADPVAHRFAECHSARIADESMLLDVAYDPRPSLLNRIWTQSGGIAIGGEEMLLYQGILQVQLMTGSDGADPTVHGPTATTAQSHGLMNLERATEPKPQVDIRLENAMRAALREAL